MHETTRALLRHLRDLPQVADPRLDWLFVNAWDAAGYPDLDAPEPVTLDRSESVVVTVPTYDARFAELEGRIKTLFELAGSRRQDSDDQLAQITELEARLNTHSATFAAVSKRLDTTDARVAALERERPQSPPEPTPPPEPDRFVPTEPGWYWVEQPDGRRYPAWWEPGFGRNAMLWLAPVAPYAPPTRTEAEARAKPMRGDRWKCNAGTYTLTKPRADGRNVWFGCWTGEPETIGFSPGFPGETYLGNFAHELEAP